MSLSVYSLMSLEDLKDQLSVSGDGKNSVLEAILNRVTAEIEDHLGRQIVTRTTAVAETRLTEYHTFQSDKQAVYTPTLRTLERPIITVTTIHEDTGAPPAYGASTLLVADTDYQVVKPLGIIRRISSGSPIPWAISHRAVRVVYSAGYADATSVSELIRGVAHDYAALLWDEHKRGSYGVSGQSDALGNYTRFAAPRLTPEMQGRLANERRWSFWESGERDT